MAYSIAMRDAFEPASDSSLFNSMERMQVLLSILELDKEHGGCDVDLDKCVRDKVLTQVLPIHEASQVRKLYHSWCLAPFSFYPFQPLDDIRDYFGPKMSFYFAFVGHLARSLLLPAIVGSIAVGAAVGYYGTLGRYRLLDIHARLVDGSLQDVAPPRDDARVPLACARL